jgi:hypothetical protein
MVGPAAGASEAEGSADALSEAEAASEGSGAEGDVSVSDSHAARTRRMTNSGARRGRTAMAPV